jgi:hypothetical protein
MYVTLVFTTGLLAKLNHIYAMRDDSSWIGFGVFAISIAVMAAAGWPPPGHRTAASRCTSLAAAAAHTV